MVTTDVLDHIRRWWNQIVVRRDVGNKPEKGSMEWCAWMITHNKSHCCSEETCGPLNIQQLVLEPVDAVAHRNADLRRQGIPFYTSYDGILRPLR